jgi:uncharacterized DUF497 family protein
VSAACPPTQRHEAAVGSEPLASPRLADSLNDLFPDSAHVRQLGLERAGDEEVWRPWACRTNVFQYARAIHLGRQEGRGEPEKHGVSFEEAQSAFDDALAGYYPDALNAARFILIGLSNRRRLRFAVHAEVGKDFIRILSARKATKHEKEHYEND